MDENRINDQIRVPQVKLISSSGENLGVFLIADAKLRALQEGLDLVEVAPNVVPPVCKIMDYGKFRYDKAKKEKESKKSQHVSHLKEIKMHPKIEDHDYQFKMDHVREFLFKGDRVKVTVEFRGREIKHLDFGKTILLRMEDDVADLCSVEYSCKLEGRCMASMYLPDKGKIKDFLKRKGEPVNG